jgi:hypothetical protein
MYGKFSHCLPTANGLMEHLPDARLVTIPGAGHFFPVVKPLFFARALDRFLGQRPMPARRIGPRRRRIAAARARMGTGA